MPSEYFVMRPVAKRGKRVDAKKMPPALPLLTERGYTVRLITGKERVVEACRLRHRVFSEELGWTRVAPNGLERDEYDKGAAMLGLYDSKGVLNGCLRVVPSRRRFMLEGEFSGLDASGIIEKTPSTAEVSRLCIAPFARRRRLALKSGPKGLSLLLLKGLYRWCSRAGVTSVYAVADEKAFRLYRKWGLTLEAISEPAMMSAGDTALVIRLDWDKFKEVAGRETPELLEWFLI